MKKQIPSAQLELSLRADAKRNRDKLLQVAQRIFATNGISISLNEIARHAGVGVGTVYRHFPTKEKLIEAVMINHKTRLIEEADRWLRSSEPGEAFFQYFEKIIQEGIDNKAIADALARSSRTELGSSEIARDFWNGVESLLVRAQQSGSIRPDVRLDDIQVMLIGILQATGAGGAYPSRVVAVLCDGLRIK